MVDRRTTVLMLAFLMPMAVAAGVVAAAFGLRRLSHRLSIPASLVAAHGVAVLVTMVPSVFGKGGGEFPYDDIYIPYFLYPGVMFAYLNSRFSHLLWPWLQTAAGYHEGSYLCIVAIPAMLTALMGSLFWMMAGRVVEWGIRTKTAKKCATVFFNPRTVCQDRHCER
jgi:hypothetical protein